MPAFPVGVIPNVDTLIAGVNLDVHRLLYGVQSGFSSPLEFLQTDPTDPTGWTVLGSITKGYARITEEEDSTGEGHDTLIRIADVNPDLPLPLLLLVRLPNMRTLRMDGDIYQIVDVATISLYEAQVVDIKGKSPTFATIYDNNKARKR